MTHYRENRPPRDSGKKRLKLTWCEYVLILLVAVALLPKMFNHWIPATRLPQLGLYTTRSMWLNTCLYSNVVQGAGGRVYVETPDTLIRIEEDNTFTYFHLDNIFPYRFNTTDTGMEIYHDGTVYEYTHQGKYVTSYPSETFDPLLPLGPVERNGAKYYMSAEFMPTITSIKTIDEKSVNGQGRVILWSFTPSVGRTANRVLLGLILVSAIVCIRQRKHLNRQKDG